MPESFDLIEPANPHPDVTLSQADIGGLGGLQSTVRYFNQLPSPQFQIEFLSEEEQRAHNGGVGDGLAASFYCSGEDEYGAYDYYRGARDNVYTTPQEADEGSYRFVRIVDRCRTEGCGPIRPDGRYLVIGFPQVATNCHPWGFTGQPRTSDFVLGDRSLSYRNYIKNYEVGLYT